MATERLGENIGISEELIKKSCCESLKAQNSPEKLLFYVENGSSDAVFISFRGSWSVDDWYSPAKAFGETKTKLAFFRSMRSIGNDEDATVNQAFLQKFERVLENPEFQNEVQRATNQNKRIIFTGHSAGGSIAVLATIWFLETHPKTSSGTAFCVTFGSPLIGDHILSHALRRENWSQYFVHFVMRYDIVPRILLAPLSSIGKEQFEKILRFFEPKNPHFANQITVTEPEASHFYVNVMTNASSLASHAACNLMGSTNLLQETVTNFIKPKLSPYRPFGTYVFCTGNGKLVVLKNPEAVLQLLFYSCQLSCQAEGEAIARRCLEEHLGYENELRGTDGSLDMQDVVYVDQLEKLDGALNDLGLSARARLCLHAAAELEKQKLKNQKYFQSKMVDTDIDEAIKGLEEYRAFNEQQVGYYDAFKIQDTERDFQANKKRLVLAGLWDEIIEKLKRYELPDEFEGQIYWIEQGTRFRHVVEPLDIANFYRHAKNEESGVHMKRGRPKRYKYTQRWFEHQQNLQKDSCGESCFWAEMEDLRKVTGNQAEVNDKEIRNRVLKLQEDVRQWIGCGVVGRDVLLEKSTFFQWWSKLHPSLKVEPIVSS